MTKIKLRRIFEKLWPDRTQLTLNSPSLTKPIAELQMEWQKKSGFVLTEHDAKLLLKLYLEEAGRRIKAESKIKRLMKKTRVLPPMEGTQINAI